MATNENDDEPSSSTTNNYNNDNASNDGESSDDDSNGLDLLTFLEAAFPGEEDSEDDGENKIPYFISDENLKAVELEMPNLKEYICKPEPNSLKYSTGNFCQLMNTIATHGKNLQKLELMVPDKWCELSTDAAVRYEQEHQALKHALATCPNLDHVVIMPSNDWDEEHAFLLYLAADAMAMRKEPFGILEIGSDRRGCPHVVIESSKEEGVKRMKISFPSTEGGFLFDDDIAEEYQLANILSRPFDMSHLEELSVTTYRLGGDNILPFLQLGVRFPRLKEFRYERETFHEPSDQYVDASAFVVNLLNTSPNLEVLHLPDTMQVNAQQLYQALQNKNKLRVLSVEVGDLENNVCNSAPTDVCFHRFLLQQLETSNTTLEEIDKCMADFYQMDSSEEDRLDYYLKLNSLGRGRMRCNTTARSALVESWDKIQTPSEYNQHGFCNDCVVWIYGMLRENPTAWAGPDLYAYPSCSTNMDRKRPAMAANKEESPTGSDESVSKKPKLAKPN